MDEMDVLRLRFDQQPAPAAEVVSRARQVMFRSEGRARSRIRRPTRPARVVLSGVLAVTLAGGLLAALTLRGGNQGGFFATPPANAADVLYHAAAVARQAPSPRAGQFFYIVERGLSASIEPDGTGSYVQPELQQTWFPVSTRDTGLERVTWGQPRVINGPALPPDAAQHPPGSVSLYRVSGCTKGAWSWWAPTYSQLSTLPTDPAKLYATILRAAGAPGGFSGASVYDQAWSLLRSILEGTPGPPPVQAALFEAATKFPGVTMVGDMVDFDGRRGIAVARLGSGSPATRIELIFDRTTYRLLGDREVFADSGGGFRSGTILDQVTIQQVSLVNGAPRSQLASPHGPPC